MANGGWFKTKIGNFKELIGTLKRNPVWSVTFAAIALVGGFIANDLYSYARDQIVGSGDNYIAELAEQQKKEFSELKGQLSSIQSSLSGEARDKFYEIKDSFERIQDTNQSLINQLSIAKEENKRLAVIAASKTNASGGFDYILSKGNALTVDGASSITLDYVKNYDDPVKIILNSSEELNTELRMKSGESHAFKSASGSNCRFTILSANLKTEVAIISLKCTP